MGLVLGHLQRPKSKTGLTEAQKHSGRAASRRDSPQRRTHHLVAAAAGRSLAASNGVQASCAEAIAIWRRIPTLTPIRHEVRHVPPDSTASAATVACPTSSTRMPAGSSLFDGAISR